MSDMTNAVAIETLRANYPDACYEQLREAVDADAFKADYGMKDDCVDCEKEMRGKAKACEYDRIYSKMDFCGWIDDAPTIVEAEGEP